jgi:UPF0176 protein
VSKKVPKIKNNTLVMELILSKTKYWSVLIEENEINIGDTILIKGMTTGEQQLVITEMQVNDIKADKAVAGDICTFQLPLEFDYQINYINSKLVFIIKF